MQHQTISVIITGHGPPSDSSSQCTVIVIQFFLSGISYENTENSRSRVK